MTPEQIFAKVYSLCAERFRTDMVPSIVNALTDELRKIADDCDALLVKELAKKKKGKDSGHSG